MVTAVGLLLVVPGGGRVSPGCCCGCCSFCGSFFAWSDRSFAVGLSDSLIGLVTADLVIVF